MSKTTKPDVEAGGGIAAEINTVLAGQNPLNNLKVAQTGPHHYSVLSARNGSVRMHRVNIEEPACTCEDFKYNTEDGEREVCAHVAKCMLAADSHLAAEDASVAEMAMHLRDLRDAESRVAEIGERLTEMADDVETSKQVATRSQQAVEAGEAEMDPAEAIRQHFENNGAGDDLNEVKEVNGKLHVDFGYLDDKFSEVIGGTEFEKDESEFKYGYAITRHDALELIA